MSNKKSKGVELPKLNQTVSKKKNKNKPIVRKSIYVNDISDTYVIKTKNNVLLIVVFIILFILIIMLFAYGLRNRLKTSIENIVTIADIEVVNYHKDSNVVDIAIVPSSEQVYCAIGKDNTDEIEYQKLSNEKCYVTVPLSEQYVYFKNSSGIVSSKLAINDYVVTIDMDKKQYVPLEKENKIYNNLVVVGNPKVNFITLGDNILIKDNSYISKKKGNTKIQAVVNDKVIAETEIVVTDVIVDKPKKFNDNKKFLTCKAYTQEEAALLDEILAYRIEQAGYGTRAGAVEAARFLTLEFPYRISYYWESGRLNNTGRHYVDGEGRYYHKGLYLDTSKYEDIEASLFGPAMWGCKLMSYEDDPPNFKPGVKYPNGLDCSGFVTWSLFNGGFDVGDRGAGESPSKGQLTDLGEFRLLTKELINSGEIKVGDLFNFWGHISILIGQDENNYYIAESLNTYEGVVVKTYSKKKVRNTFKYVVLMDSVYNGDGNLTDMWY